ncbi:hypothetical protein Q8W71_15515 [Methylobacterium sp. NEAU 140]|uniref:hypothetical protein n=1 Tax=Methylobacterium sp. NEAU 140 TaxID=3064945 RepID=UPI0027362BF9|nr:hypothetical protein [Methylobacterium sp. NEAU 140]MDP4024037.1 hypothetical protein [Methylobacterium sp. NEAU 140]
MFETGAERIDTLAKHSPLSRSAIYTAIADGELTARKHGGCTIILKADWEAFLASRPVMERKPRNEGRP